MTRARGTAARVAAAIVVGSAAAVPAAAAPAASARASTPAAPAAAGARYEIHVHASPGMDERALARAVAAELDRRERDQAIRRRSSFDDRGA